MHGRERAAHLHAQLGVQAQRPVVVRDLEQPDARGVARVGALEDRVHQHPPDVVVLGGGVHADGPDGRDGPALVEEVGPEDPAVLLRHHAEDLGVVDQPADGLRGGLDRREVVREAMLVGQRGEGLVADPPGLLPVRIDRLPDRDPHARRSHDAHPRTSSRDIAGAGTPTASPPAGV